jgi:hypothetical protein
VKIEQVGLQSPPDVQVSFLALWQTLNVSSYQARAPAMGTMPHATNDSNTAVYFLLGIYAIHAMKALRCGLG